MANSDNATQGNVNGIKKWLVANAVGVLCTIGVLAAQFYYIGYWVGRITQKVNAVDEQAKQNASDIRYLERTDR